MNDDLAELLRQRDALLSHLGEVRGRIKLKKAEISAESKAEREAARGPGRPGRPRGRERDMDVLKWAEEGVPLKEIAARIGRSVATARNDLARGKRRRKGDQWRAAQSS